MAESKWFHKTETLAEFETLITSLEDKKKKIAISSGYQDYLAVYVFFHGAHDSTTGKSWCPVCVKAEPLVEQIMKSRGRGAKLVFASVGEKAEWEDPKSPFRTDPRFKQLTSLPTLMIWGGNHSLSGEKCTEFKEVLMHILTEQLFCRESLLNSDDYAFLSTPKHLI